MALLCNSSCTLESKIPDATEAHAAGQPYAYAAASAAAAYNKRRVPLEVPFSSAHGHGLASAHAGY